MPKLRKNQGVRIIAGKWRGRRLPVPDVPGLRPTGDRVRETLFNWLQADICGARCLDMFAGSGALGLEAASRGAVSVALLEKHPQAVKQLQENCRLLAAENIEVENVDSLDWLNTAKPGSFDVIFIDPPFNSQWQSSLLEKIALTGMLTEHGRVYVESARRFEAPLVSAGLRELKIKLLGEVRMQLFAPI
ncbi:MAG: 16S rRNA (guanine(966)-N(2))-methyltransferase RsmD [Xanthomonadales bacterium]|nr:16S rRNA (guanine(966)-N(2))-methyltransferase RsmD [Xanthomonadales bacterium]